MHSNKLPKQVQKWVDKHPDMVESIHVELDEFMPEKGPYSIWCYLKAGYICEEVHQIHEATAKDFMEQTKKIKVCRCEDCEKYL